MRQLDLVGLATVCDVVPVTGVNRAFVSQGLKVLGQRSNIGLACLADAAGLNSPPSGHTFGFMLGPRINAGGRIGASDLGVKLLSARSGEEASGIAGALDDLNTRRREIEQEIRAHALDMAMEQHDRPVVLVGHPDWHEGVIGIVAGRLRETLGKPACVVAIGDTGIGKGSGRLTPTAWGNFMIFCATDSPARSAQNRRGLFARCPGFSARPGSCRNLPTGCSGLARSEAATLSRALPCRTARSPMPSRWGVTARIFPAVLMMAVAAP